MTVVTNWVCGRLRKSIEIDVEFHPYVTQVARMNNERVPANYNLKYLTVYAHYFA